MNNVENKKLSLFTKLSYGASEIGAQFSWMLIGSYLSLFYTDVVGLAPAVISIIFLAARVWDAIDDPMMGLLADHTKTRWGKFRPYLLFGAPILAILNILAFTTFDFSPTGKTIYALVTYFLVGVAYTALCIAQGSLSNVMTHDNTERMQLSTFRGIASSIGSLILSAATMPLILYFGGSTSSARGYTMTAIVFSIIGLFCYWLTFANCKEVITFEKKQQQAIPVKDALKVIFSHRDFMLEILFIIITLSGAAGRFGVLSHYIIYTIGRPDLISSIMLLGSVCCMVPQLFLPHLTKRFNKKTLLLFSNLGMALGCTIIYFAGIGVERIYMVYIGTAVWGLSNVLSPVLFALTAEMIDDIEVTKGIRPDGTGYSVFSFSTKLASAIGGSLGVALLGVIGYVANETQTTAVKQGIAAVTNLGPVALYLLALIPLLLIRMNNKKAKENEITLRERAAENTSQ